MGNSWTKIPFGEFINFNPKVPVKKGEFYTYIPMEKITPKHKFVKTEIIKEFQGSGAKFKNGDILFARISPCLENGKIAQAKNLKNLYGFGSTEFFIFRGIDGISDSNFIYYYSLTSWFRKNAINSMLGTSGRQRVDASFIAKSHFKFPPFHIQKKIANILSSYDDLIENNLKKIKLLEELAQITYKEWFIHLRFPGYENTPINPDTGLPKNWEKIKLKDICNLIMGQSPSSEYYNTDEKGLPFHQGVTSFGLRFPTTTAWSKQGSKYAEQGDILVSVRAPVGRINIAIEKIILGRGLAAIKHKKKQQSFIYYQLKTIFFKENIMGEGAIFNSVTKQDMNNIQMLKPSIKLQNMFDEFAKTIDYKILLSHHQNKLLKEARDILLPRLMMGLIDVEKYDSAKLLEETITA
jgi:type I restriction enzyme, S subunit